MRAWTFPLLVAALVAPALPAVAAEDELAPYAKAIADAPDDAKAYEAYGTKALGMQRFDDAIAKLKIGVARIPEFTNGYYLLAYAFRKKGAWADAADYYRRCIMLKHKENDSQFGLGKSLAGLGDKKGAIASFKKYVASEKRPQMQRFVDEANGEIAKLEPPPAPPPAPVADAAALRAQADALRNEKKFDEAAAAYKKAIDADKDNLDLYNDLGNVYFTLKRYNDAATAFQEAVKRNPGYALGWYNLGHALRKGDRKGEAVEAIRKYIKLKPEDPDPYYGLGQTLKALGDLPAAKTAFTKYVEMEKREGEQKWVEKARQELAAIDAQQKPAAPPPPPPGAGKVSDEKSHVDGLVDPFDGGGAGSAPPQRPTLRDLHDPFVEPSLDGDGLLDPFRRGAGRAAPLPPEGSKLPAVEPRVREYGRAITAYRRALAAQVEDVETRWERGVASALAGKPRDAVAAWNTIALDDARVAAARRGIETARK